MGHKIGIVISIENYQSGEFGLSKVDYATNDGDAVRQLFVDVFGIDQDDIFYFKDERFTCTVGKSELQYYLQRIPEESEIYLYYAGHGFFFEGKNYLTAYDTSTLDLVETSISFEDLFLDSFRKSGAKSCVAFIDACAEGVNSNYRGIPFRGIDLTAAKEEDDSSFRYALYFACSPKEKAVPDDELQHGVWTWFLIQALKGDEKAFDQGRYISTDSLSDYLKCSVTDYTKRKKQQTPYSVMSSSGSWKLVDFGDDLSFEDKVYQAYGEFLFQCDTANQELAVYVCDEILNFAQARDLCWEISDRLCPDWDEIVTSMEFYVNTLNRGKSIKLTYSGQIELLKEFETLINSFPTYINQCIYTTLV